VFADVLQICLSSLCLPRPDSPCPYPTFQCGPAVTGERGDDDPSASAVNTYEQVELAVLGVHIISRCPFEVQKLGLTEQSCAASEKLKQWCERNKDRCCIPESLLKRWGILVDPNLAAENSDKSIPPLELRCINRSTCASSWDFDLGSVVFLGHRYIV